MPSLKKFIFAFPFLIFLFLACMMFFPLSQNYLMIFEFNLGAISNFLMFSGSLILASLCFVICVVLANELKYILPISVLGSVVPLLLVLTESDKLVLGIILAGGFLICFLGSFFLVRNKLNTYLNFQPGTLFSSNVKNLAIFLSLILSLGYYLVVNQAIQKNGFEIPDHILDAGLNVINIQSIETVPVKGFRAENPRLIAQNLPGVTPEQLEFLQSNPQLLEQYGVDPSVINNLNTAPPSAGTSARTNNFTSPTLSDQMLKPLIKKQFENMLNPYTDFIPIILAALFFVLIYSIISLLMILVPLVIWLVFIILEKSGFIRYTTETREIKKMIV